jgi:hypothetical protein
VEGENSSSDGKRKPYALVSSSDEGLIMRTSEEEGAAHGEFESTRWLGGILKNYYIIFTYSIGTQALRINEKKAHSVDYKNGPFLILLLIFQ